MGLFWRHGFDGVSQQQMVDATGLSSSSLFNSFGTKPAIYEVVVRRYMATITAVLEPLEDGRRGVEDLTAFFDRFAELIDGPLGVTGCLAMSAMVEPPHGTDRVASLAHEYRVRQREAFAAALRRGRALGEPVPDPDATAALLQAILLGIQATARATGDRKEPRAQLEAAYALVATWRS